MMEGSKLALDHDSFCRYLGGIGCKRMKVQDRVVVSLRGREEVRVSRYKRDCTCSGRENAGQWVYLSARPKRSKTAVKAFWGLVYEGWCKFTCSREETRQTVAPHHYLLLVLSLGRYLCIHQAHHRCLSVHTIVPSKCGCACLHLPQDSLCI